MPLDEQIKKAAEKIWVEIKQRQFVYLPVMDFSPQSLWVIDRLFESPRQREAGGLLHFWEAITPRSPAGIIQRQDRIFEIGAYVGEVVRQNVKGYEWNCDPDRVTEETIELFLPEKVDGRFPNGNSLLPMNFVSKKIGGYEQGDIVQWGRDAGLPIGNCPKHPDAAFQKPAQ